MRTPAVVPLLAALTTVLAAVVPRPAIADEQPRETRRTITVTGQGEITVSPDLAILALAVETTAPKASDAANENATRSARVAAELKRLIGKNDKVTTTRYSLEPRYEPAKRGEPGEPHIIGYVARNEVQVETQAINAVGGFIDAAIGAGANRINSLQFTLTNRNEQLRAALQKAGSEARAQAESVANALGVKLKSVLSATTASPPIIQPRRFEALGMAAAEARAPPPIEPGTVSVSASLQVTYEIE
jgi:uncharacterized protein YggE